jgi:hypothetical protein
MALGLFLNTARPAVAQSIVYTDWIYKSGITTVLFAPTDDDLALPFIELNGPRTLRLRFDDLLGQRRNLNYTVVHCDVNWQPSNLLKAEYLQDFQEYWVDQVDFSFNTFVPYTHYELVVPNQAIQLTKSGNYLLIVYENNPEEPVLTRRFVVFENLVNVGVRVNRPVKVDFRDTHQEVDFFISHPSYDIPDPFTELTTVVVQNRRWDRALVGLQPRFVREGHLDYDYESENLFPGGNEFRNFDTKDVPALTLNLRKVELDSNFKVFLATDPDNAFRKYFFNPDINGQLVVRRMNVQDVHLQADYVWVDFFLKTSGPVMGGKIYVLGQLTDWRIKPEYQLTYDAARGGYRGKALIKQGYINYQYVFVDDNQKIWDETLFEGNHWETENQYTILVYQRPMGLRYDKVIGIGTANSQLIR